MKIQEFACETAPQSVEYTEEAIALLEKLGAKGQEAYYKENKTVCPYRKMTPVERAVYMTVCPEREDLDKYNAGPIPLRVLQIGAHAVELLQGTLVVWHAGVGKDDPLLTLRTGSTWSGEHYLLARWGEELDEFSVLIDRAVSQLTEEARAKLMKGKGEIESWLASCENAVRSRLSKGKTDGPSVHWFD